MNCFLLAVLLTAFAVSNAADDTDQCASGWSYHKTDNKCIKVFDSLLTWRSAYQACEKEDGRMLTIPNDKTQKFVNQLLPGGGISFWIGLSDMWKEGEFWWVDGTKMSYQNWLPNQPDKYVENGHPVDEDCVQIYDNKQWNDRECNYAAKYICEKRGPGCNDQNGGCPEVCTDGKDEKWTVTCSTKTCKQGFGLENGKCYDIDECSLENGGCDQICANTIGSWQCTCYPDFVYNGTRCNIGDDTIIG